ncbi:glyoxalase superfamily protein [Streptomyces sp. NPDC101219]|uniref:glyoxalase superfamily protein n=1 Tax=Streptomyces sp. NPDC101219 TaxID=3366131 RepID=UPI0037F61E0A
MSAERAVPVLRVRDMDTSLPWYARLGFGPRWEHRFGPGFPRYAELARGPVRLHLSEHEGDARPDGLVYLRLADPRAVAAEFGAELRDQPWGPEVELRDPDGNRLRVGPLDD